jgi:2-polyprenyl-3-methyl-5-hydroxy-6-metoxy-1,4-benzoquinol methylase
MKTPADGASGPLEADRLASIAADSWYARGANAATVLYSARVFERFWRGTRCLEMGPAEGLMTPILAGAFAELTVVEGAFAFVEDLRRRFPGVEVIHSLFEEYEPAGRFDTIVLGHVLEHVEDPRDILARAGSWLADGGRICAAVPNARSIHRQAAVTMGLLPDEHALNDTDRHHGHRRVFDPETLRDAVRGAGLRVHHLGGYWLKPVSNGQIEATWTAEMLEAFMALGERHPDIAAEIYVIAEAERHGAT